MVSNALRGNPWVLVADLAKRRAQELKDQAAVTIERGKSTVQRQKESLSAAVDAGRAAYRDTVNQPLPE